MTMIPELKPLEKKDYPGLNVLFKKAFNSDRSLETWIWKYDANPHGMAIATVATVPVSASHGVTDETESANTHVVGFYGLMPRKADVMGKRLFGWQEVDLMVDPEYAAGGLFKRLGRETYQRLCDCGHPFTFGFPNQTSLPAGKRILGWKVIEKIPLWTMLLNPADALSEKLPAIPGLKQATDAVFRMHNRYRLRSRWYGRIREESCITGKMAVFFNIPWSDSEIVFERDPDYMTWRYEQSPEHRYQFFAAESSTGEVQAAAVMGLSGNKRANLAELRVLNGMEDAGRALLRHIAGFCRDNGYTTLRAWALKGSPEACFFQSSGYFDRNAQNYHVIRSFRPPEFNRYLWDPQRWRLSAGDSDCV